MSVVKNDSVRNLITVPLLCLLVACCGSGNSNEAVDGSDSSNPNPVAPAVLTAPDVNRADTDDGSLGTEPFPVAAFYRAMQTQGAHFILNGQFGDAQTAGQRHEVSRMPLVSPAMRWLDRSDLKRTVITVDRYEDGVAASSDRYADYFDSNNRLVGSRTKGQSVYGLIADGIRRPETARTGERGVLGQLTLSESGSETPIGYREISWEMLVLSDGAPAYCEKSRDLNPSGDETIVAEMCFGLSANGDSNGRVTYSFVAGGASGSLVATDFAFGVAANATMRIDGQIYGPGTVVARTESTQMDCLSVVDGPVTDRWYLGDPVPPKLRQSTYSWDFVVADGTFTVAPDLVNSAVRDFRWDAFEGAYVGSEPLVQEDGLVSSFAMFDEQLRALFYAERRVLVPESGTSSRVECYDGVLNRIAPSAAGPTAVLQCTGVIFPWGDTTIPHTLTINRGRLLVSTPNQQVDDYEIDLTMVDDYNQWGISSFERRAVETLSDGWTRWTEWLRIFQTGERRTVVEFDEQWNIRRYERNGSDGRRSDYFECSPG